MLNFLSNNALLSIIFFTLLAFVQPTLAVENANDFSLNSVSFPHRFTTSSCTYLNKKTKEKRKSRQERLPGRRSRSDRKGEKGDPGPQGPQGAPGPGFVLGASPAQLHFQFNSNMQAEAEGVFVAVITLPDQSQMTIEGDIGPIGIPYGVYIGSPSILGTYVVGYYVKSTTHPLDKPPILWVTNSMTGDVYKCEFSLNGGNCDFKYFVNRLPDFMR